MIAVDRARGLVVQAVDREDVSVVVAVQLLAVAAVHFHGPKRVHLDIVTGSYVVVTGQ